jgi:chorismate mutase
MSGKTVSRAPKRMEAAARIRKARLRIDAIDRAVVRLLAFRASVVAEISRVRGAQRRDPKREREVIRNALRLNGRMTRKLGVGYPDRLVADIFKVIIEAGGAVRAGVHAGRRFGQPREPSLRSVPK